VAEPQRTLHVGRGASAIHTAGESAVALGHCDYEPPLRLLAGGVSGWGGVGAACPQDHVWSSGPQPAALTAMDDGQGLSWRCDGEWTFGRLLLPESAAADLEALSHLAYTRLFAALAQAGTPHLVRLWNYLPRINQEQAGLERYRRFNLGRQAAFQQAGRSAFDGAPAACALGCPGPAGGDEASACSGLTLYFLAGRQPVTPIENPRQVSAYRYPSQYGPAAPSFSRAALADLGGGSVGLFISGTASIVGHETVHLGDVRAQTRETLTNLRTLCAQASLRAGRPFRVEDLELVVYLRHPADLAAVRDELTQALGADSPALRSAIVVQADVCRADLLVEIEAHGLAPAATGAAGPAR